MPKSLTNLKLQIGQLILGASQQSTTDSAGSDSRLRFSFIARYQRDSQRYRVWEKGFNFFCNLPITIISASFNSNREFLRLNSFFYHI